MILRYKLYKSGRLVYKTTKGYTKKRYITQIERWAVARGYTLNEIGDRMGVNQKVYNEKMEDTEKLTVRDLRRLMKITDQTLWEMVKSTITSKSLKDMSEEEIMLTMSRGGKTS